MIDHNQFSVDDQRLDSTIWIEAGLRTHAVSGQSYYIVQKGDSKRGTLLIKIVSQNIPKFRVLMQARDETGLLCWANVVFAPDTPEREIDAYITRQASNDPDLWIVELESRDGTHPFSGKTLTL